MFFPLSLKFLKNFPDELYGSREDLRQLVEAAHQRGLKVILDFVPNHTSDKHTWFEASVFGISPYHDYYVWANATYVDGVRTPPNNWVSSFYSTSKSALCRQG